MTQTVTLALTVPFLLLTSVQHVLVARRLYESDRQPPYSFATNHRKFFIGFHCALVILSVILSAALLVVFLGFGGILQDSEMWEARSGSLVVSFGAFSEVRLATLSTLVLFDVTEIVCFYPALWTEALSMKAELFFQIPVASTVGLVLTVFGIWKYRLPQLVLDGTLLAAVGEGLCLWSTRSKGVRSGTTVSANKGAVLITCRFCSGVVVIVLLPLARRLQVYVLVPLILTQVCQSLIHCLAIWNKMQSDKKNKELASNYFRTPSYASIEEGQMLFFRDPLIFGAKNQLVCLGFPHAPGLKAGEALLMLLVSSLTPRCRVKWGPFKTERMPHDARSNSPRTMNNIEITTPETFKIDPAGPPKRRRRNNKPPSHILRASRRTRGFRWPGENDVTIARSVLDRIKSNPIPVKMTIHDDITRLIALLGSVESAERPFFQAHVALVLDIAISEQWLDLDQGNTYLEKVLPGLENKTIQWWRSENRRSFRAMAKLRMTTGNCAYAIYLHKNPSAKGQFTDSDFAYIESIRDGRPVNCQEYEQLSPVNLGPALCRKLTAADIEKALRPPKSTSRGDKAKKSHPTAEEAAVQISPLDPMPRDSQQSIPLYGMFRLYPAPDDSQFSKQQEQLKRKHDDARAEIMERKLSADHTLEKSKYPACTDFMAEVVGYLRSTNLKCEGTLHLFGSNFRTPASEPLLLRLMIKGANCTAGRQGVLCLAVPYFTETRRISILEEGMDWTIDWPSNCALVFLEQIVLPSNDNLRFHIQSFQQSTSDYV